MNNTERLCLGCMNEKGSENACSICGWDSSSKNPDFALPAASLLANRFVIGRVTAVDGEGISYIAFDKANDLAVTVKEYFPKGFALRNPDKTVSMVLGEEYIFNEGLLEFLEISKKIMASDLLSLIPVVAVFEENSTAYSVTKNVSGISLEAFLEKNGGTLKWEQARPLFLPLIDTVKGMNDLGIVHGGISPETIMVCRDGKLRISGYSIKKLRYESSELDSTVYAGYAAVEQYASENVRLDSYTDVYGLAAVFFRVLMGVTLAKSSVRLQNDAMTIPAKFAEEIPRQVLAALANGLQVLPKNRTKNIEIFKNELVYGEISAPAAPAAASNAKAKKGSGAKYVLISSLCTAVVFVAVALILIFGVFKEQFFPVDNTDSSSETSSFDTPSVDQIGDYDSDAAVSVRLYDVPNFTGKYYSEIHENDDYEMFDISVVDKAFSDKCPKGTVVSQSVKAGEGVERNTEIELVISLGPKNVKMPSLSGLTYDEAVLELLKAGFIYENIEQLEKYDEDLEPGVVIDQSPKYSENVVTDIAVKIYINSYLGEEEVSSDENTTVE